MRLVRRLALGALAALGVLVVAVLGWTAWVYAGVLATAQSPQGTLQLAGLQGIVRVDRDSRGIPHIRARNDRDLFFAQGYVEGCDRLFQLDLYRRLSAGRLAEILGAQLLPTDETSRVFDIQGTVAAEERSLTADDRADLEAFGRGVQAAIDTRPLPPEFRILGYRPEPWHAGDALLVAFATVIALADSWDEIVTRDDVARGGPARVLDAFYPITDPAYDVPIDGTRRAPVAPLPRLDIRYPAPLLDASLLPERAEVGSNDFAAGAALTATHRALLANDPHLQLRIPGVWYLIDLEAPRFHVAGATLAGVPGVILGHNEHLAWGATNGSVATTRVYRERFKDATSDEYLDGTAWVHAVHRRETFGVRFGKSATHDYLATRHGFVFERRGTIGYAAGWTGVYDTRSGLATYVGLSRAANVPAALRVLSQYPGPPQNFVLADDRGNAGYALAGDVWHDAVWGRHAIDGPGAAGLRPQYLPFAALPRVAPSRRALVFTANDRTYGAGYPYRLTAFFEAPYRAARIAQLLHEERRYDVPSFSAIQADALSLAERDLAHAAAAALERRGDGGDAALAQAGAALRGFDGLFTGDSQAATYAWALRGAASRRLVRYHFDGALGRRYLSQNTGLALVAVLCMLREHPKGWVPADDYDGFLVASTRDAVAALRKAGMLGKKWADVGGRTAQHPLAALGVTMWNGVPFPGYGDAFTPHAQGPSVTQSFRAVWDVGNWDRGGIVIPQGESGDPGSAHYRDGAPVWLGGTLVPLPFDDAAIARDRSSTLTLTP